MERLFAIVVLCGAVFSGDSQRWPRLSVQPNPIYKWIPCQLGRDALRQFIKVNAVRCHPVKS